MVESESMTRRTAWRALVEHHGEIKGPHLPTLFAEARAVAAHHGAGERA
jgi:hypothetical protein